MTTGCFQESKIHWPLPGDEFEERTVASRPTRLIRSSEFTTQKRSFVMRCNRPETVMDDSDANDPIASERKQSSLAARLLTVFQESCIPCPRLVRLREKFQNWFANIPCRSFYASLLFALNISHRFNPHLLKRWQHPFDSFQG